MLCGKINQNGSLIVQKAFKPIFDILETSINDCSVRSLKINMEICDCINTLTTDCQQIVQNTFTKNLGRRFEQREKVLHELSEKVRIEKGYLKLAYADISKTAERYLIYRKQLFAYKLPSATDDKPSSVMRFQLLDGAVRFICKDYLDALSAVKAINKFYSSHEAIIDEYNEYFSTIQKILTRLFAINKYGLEQLNKQLENDKSDQQAQDSFASEQLPVGVVVSAEISSRPHHEDRHEPQ